MSERVARRGRSARFSRRVILASSLAALALCGVALVWLLRPRPGPPAAGQQENVAAIVTVDAAELKREPDARSATVGKLSRGARIQVLRDRGLWIEVRTKEASGFLPAEALERDSDREVRARRAGTILAFPPVAGLVAEDADLLLAPFPLAARTGRLEKGTTVRIHAVDHAYYALKGPDGGLAFVDSAKVDVIPPDPRRPAIEPAREHAPRDIEVTELVEPPAAEGEDAPAREAVPPSSADGATPPPGPAFEEPLEPASLLSRVEPVYPDLARRAGAEGTVELQATIGADGRVQRVVVLRGLPFGLSEAAVSAVRRWQYRPARGRVGPIPSRKEVRIEFRLRP